MKIRAAVMTAPNRALEVADVELDAPRRDEVLVRIEASDEHRRTLARESQKSELGSLRFSPPTQRRSEQSAL